MYPTKAHSLYPAMTGGFGRIETDSVGQCKSGDFSGKNSAHPFTQLRGLNYSSVGWLTAVITTKQHNICDIRQA
jgi:hypothetical protein